MKLLAILLLLPLVAFAAPDPLKETRYCTTEPKRNAKGEIVRRADVLREFRKLYPCPATGLASGGCDGISNLDWMPTAIKSCARPECRDRWERDVYRRRP